MEHRQRNGYLVSAVIVGHFVLISAQAGGGHDGSVLEDVAFRAFAQMQRLLTSARGAVAHAWSHYVELRDVHDRNDELTLTVADLQLLLQEQQALAQQARGLQELLGLRQALDLRTVVARVIATAATPYVRTLTVDRGAEDGVHADDAVIAPEGIVGRIVGAPGPRASRVQLLIDHLAAAGARVERTRASGIVTGGDDGTALRMDYVSNHEQVRVGDRVVTSGTDGIYPPGFLIGTVASVAPGPELDLAIRIVPAVRFSRLEDVLVIVSDDEPLPPLSVASE